MKYRSDFVTNSSSSSYIISRKTVGEKATIRDIQRMIDGFYPKTMPDYMSADIYDLNSPNIIEELGRENCIEILSWYFGECLLDWFGDWLNFDWSTFDWDNINYGIVNFTYEDFDFTESEVPQFMPENVCKRCEKGSVCGLRKHLEINGYTVESALRYMGDFCIFHDYEVYYLAKMNELHAVCSYFCNHMG